MPNNPFAAKLVEQAAEIQRLKTWVSDLQSGMFINCVYCGHRYGPKEGTPVAMADVLKAHIVQCPKHPLSIVTKALFDLVEAKRVKDRDGKTPEYEKARDEAWKAAEVALKSVGVQLYDPMIGWGHTEATLRAMGQDESE